MKNQKTMIALGVVVLVVVLYFVFKKQGIMENYTSKKYTKKKDKIIVGSVSEPVLVPQKKSVKKSLKYVLKKKPKGNK